MPESKEITGPVGEALISVGKAQQYLLAASKIAEGGSFKTVEELADSLRAAMSAYNELTYAANRCMAFADVVRPWKQAVEGRWNAEPQLGSGK